MTFELNDFWHVNLWNAGWPWHCLGQFRRPRSRVTVQGHRRFSTVDAKDWLRNQSEVWKNQLRHRGWKAGLNWKLKINSSQPKFTVGIKVTIKWPVRLPVTAFWFIVYLFIHLFICSFIHLINLLIHMLVLHDDIRPTSSQMQRTNQTARSVYTTITKLSKQGQ